MELKEFLLNNMELIKAENFTELYACTTGIIQSGKLTDFFIQNNIDPLMYLSVVPASYAEHCKELEEVTIPDHITQVQMYAFNDCENLRKVVIKAPIKVIDRRIFGNCHKLTDIEIPASVTRLNYKAFFACYALANIRFNGTKEQWQAVVKESLWRIGVPAKTVHCIDGDVEI